MKKARVNNYIDNDILNEYLNEIKSNPLLKDYEIDEFNVNIFENYLKELKACNNCSGLESCQNETKGFYTTIIQDGFSYKTVAAKCQYKNEYDNNLNNSRLIKTFYIPKSFLNARLIDYQVSSRKRQIIIEYIDTFIKSCENKKQMIKGLLLTGTYGVGKTFVLAALANELSRVGVSSLMIYFPDLCRELKSSIGTPRLEELVNELKSVDVLILDDFGSEMMTEWIRDEILSPVVNYRFGEKLPLFITTNLNLQEIQRHLSNSGKTDDQQKATRLLNKIFELCKVIELDNNDSYKH